MTQIRQIRELPRHLRHIEPLKQKRACAYVRVSTGSDKQLQSLQNQMEYYERYIIEQSGYIFCGIYSDAGISGSRGNRPGFMAMMEAARNGQVDVILTKSISRFARNTVLLLESIRELKTLAVEVIFEEQKILTLHAEGELMLTVLASIAEEERRSVCKNIQWSIRAGFKQGKAVVDANRLLGYAKDVHGNLVIDPEQARIVRMIYKRYLAGHSAYRIAKDFNLEKKSSDTGRRWVSSRISSILSNEKYMGDCLMQKQFVLDSGKEVRNTGQLDQYYVRNHHPAIIRRKDWEAVQQIREGRKPKYSPLTSMLRCPYCHAGLIHVVREKRWASWICATYMQKGKAACRGMRIPDSILQVIHAERPITEPMYVQEVPHGKATKARTKEDYQLTAAAPDLSGEQ